MASARNSTAPAYEQLQERIIESIRAGEIADGERLAGSGELAKKWDVSVSTVRNTLQILAARGVVERRQGSGTYVRAEGVRESSEAGESDPGGTRISLLLPDIGSIGYSLLGNDIQRCAHALGLDVVFANLSDREFEPFIRRQVEGGSSGIVMIPPIRQWLSIELVSFLYERGIPVVTCNRQSTCRTWPLVCVNNIASMHAGTRHLIKTGCRRIGFIDVEGFPTDGNYYHYFNGRYGYLQAMADEGLAVGKSWILNIDTRQHPGLPKEPEVVRQVEAWLAGNRELDGICCYQGGLTLLVQKILQSQGRRIPDEVALVSNSGGDPLYPIAESEITHLLGSPGVAREAVALLDRARREGVDSVAATVVAIEPELIIRSSTRSMENAQETAAVG
jgi:DNA-binding LacI/PurR family transcriptional regulator